MKATTLKPCLLVASPTLECPFFGRSVVLLVDHRDDGSLGFIVNRPAPITFEAVQEQLGIMPLRGHRAELLQGGPVAPETGWLIFDPSDGLRDGELDGLVRVAPDLAVSANLGILRRISRGLGPPRRLMTLGYAGWGPGQLDGEIREGSWLTTELDAELLFDVPMADRWRRAWKAIGIDPAQLVRTVAAEA